MVLFKHITKLKRRRGPTETIARVLLNKIQLAQLTQNRWDTQVGADFLKKVGLLRKEVYR